MKRILWALLWDVRHLLKRTRGKLNTAQPFEYNFHKHPDCARHWEHNQSCVERVNAAISFAQRLCKNPDYCVPPVVTTKNRSTQD